jgi:hypothetical protein
MMGHVSGPSYAPMSFRISFEPGGDLAEQSPGTIVATSQPTTVKVASPSGRAKSE